MDIKLFQVNMERLLTSLMLRTGMVIVLKIINLYQVRLEEWEVVFFPIVELCLV